jgi:hypothetical protein
LAIWICATVVVTPTARSEQPLTIENSELRVAFSAESASLRSVYHKRRGTYYLRPSKGEDWFRVQIPLPYWEGHSAASRDLKVLSVQKLGADIVEFRATQLITGVSQYPISTRLTFRLERDNLACRLSLQNQSRSTIDRIVFPILEVPPAQDSKEILLSPNATVVLSGLFSSNDVRTRPDPFERLDPVALKAWSYSDPQIPAKAFGYPGTLPTAWFTYVSDGKGIGWDVRDTQFQYQQALIERRLYRDRYSREANRRDYELSWNWYPLVRPGSSWESAEVYLKFDDGDWHSIAKQHRDWLKTWIRRPQVAKTFQTSLGWLSRGVRSFDDIPSIAKQGLDVGAPYFLIYGWNQGDINDWSYRYYPRPELGGLESLRRNLQAARAMGAYPLAWFNGTMSVQTTPGHQRMGKDWVARDRYGSPILAGRWSLFFPFQITNADHNDIFLEFDFDSGARDFLVDTIRRFIDDYHFTGFEMDQGAKNFLSYRDTSKRGRPELALSKGYGDFYARAVAIVKKSDPNGIIVGESFSDFMNQYVDSSWVFEGGALNVPQLSSLRYSLPWVTVPTRAVVTDRGHANRAFLMNAPLDIFDDLTQYPEYAGHLRRLHALKVSTSRYFYQGEFSDEEGFALLPPIQKEVLAKAYRDPAGEIIAIVIVNTSPATKEVTVRLDAGTAPQPGRHYYLDGRLEPQPPAAEVHLELPAYDVQLLALESH